MKGQQNKGRPWWFEHRDAFWSGGVGFMVTALVVLISAFG